MAETSEERHKSLRKMFFKENPFAEQAHQAYIDTPVNVPKDPLYFVLMAIAYEIWLENSVQ